LKRSRCAAAVQKKMLNWWYGKKAEDTSHVTEAVVDTGATLQELETKQNQLKRRAEKLQTEAMTAEEEGDEVTRDARVRDYMAVQSDIEHYGILIENTRATRATLDSVAANASVFQTQKQAVSALETVNAQMSVAEVDRTHEQLERHMDNSQQFSRVMGARLRRDPVRRPGHHHSQQNKDDPAVTEMLNKWRLQKVPKAATRGTAAADATAPPAVTERPTKVPPKMKEEEELNK
jgi:Tfp pilus assembly protein PilV